MRWGVVLKMYGASIRRPPGPAGLKSEGRNVRWLLQLAFFSPGLPVVLHSLLLTVLLVQLSSSQSTLLPLKQSNLLAVLHAPLVVLNGLPVSSAERPGRQPLL